MREKFYENSNILITGAGGTVGRALLSAILEHLPKFRQIIGIDNSEIDVFWLKRNYSDDRIKFCAMDINDFDSINEVFNGIDVVFHLAAYKHVHICEENPNTALSINVAGTQSVIKACKQNKVKHLIFSSSDKAVDVSTVLGATKLLAEKLVCVAGKNSSTNFSSVRFGNILHSSGSVVPLFEDRLNKGLQLCVNNLEMTRFFMTAKQAVDLMLDVPINSIGGDVFVLKMQAARIQDLAFAVLQKHKQTKGLKGHQDDWVIEGNHFSGEKIHESLMTVEESVRAVDLGNMFQIFPFGTSVEEIKATIHGMRKLATLGCYSSGTSEHLNTSQLVDLLSQS